MKSLTTLGRGYENLIKKKQGRREKKLNRRERKTFPSHRGAARSTDGDAFKGKSLIRGGVLFIDIEF